MDVMEAIKTRKSVRSYLDKPIEDEKLAAVLDAARLAPSARNCQEWRFILVKERNTRRALAVAANNQAFVGDAPVIIAACAAETDHVMSCGYKSHTIDVAIALDHMALEAVEQGLGTCWIGAFDQQKVKDILGVPEEASVVELMPIGYPSDPTVKHKSRMPMSDLIMQEKWESKRK
jgi:nitroreductase